MGYYSDLFVRPKQAILFARDHPSWARSVGFVLLGTLVGIVSMFLFTNEILVDVVLSTLLWDIARWLSGGILLLILGVVFKRIPANKDTLNQVLSMLSHINVYGFFFFLLLAVLLPALAVPQLVTAVKDANNGIIGPEEFDAALVASLDSIGQAGVLVLVIAVLSLLLLLYSFYSLYLAIHKFLDITVFKTILVMILFLAVQSALILGISG